MYWYGHLSIDPSHLTQIRKKPTRGFRRFAEVLSAGIISEKEEVETFTAVSILQELNMTLRSIGVTDLLRFRRDDVVLYADEDSQDGDDMNKMFDHVEGTSSSTSFETLSLMLEHHLQELALVIEVRISRTHSVGVFPIQITVNGLAAKLTNSSGELNEHLEQTFSSQSHYDGFVHAHREEFEKFMNQLELAVRRTMKIDDVRKTIRSKILRPESSGLKKKNNNNIADGDQDPVFDRYDSSSDVFMYCWLWSSLSHTHDIHVADTVLVDETGLDVLELNEQGVDAGSSSLLDTNTPLAEVTSEDWSSVSGGIDGSNANMWGVDTADATDSSWLSGWDFGAGDAGGDAGGCSSCGGGCGGGCGGCGG